MSVSVQRILYGVVTGRKLRLFCQVILAILPTPQDFVADLNGSNVHRYDCLNFFLSSSFKTLVIPPSAAALPFDLAAARNPVTHAAMVNGHVLKQHDSQFPT